MANQIIYIKSKSNSDGKQSDRYRTPWWLIDHLDDIYHFTCDAAADDDHHLFDKYYTEQNSAMDNDWSENNGNIFCNPPFSRGMKEKFLLKAYDEMIKNHVSTVFIIPSDITNVCWRKYIFGKATKITAINGRVIFVHPETGLEPKSGLGVAIVEFMYGKNPVDYIGYAVRDEMIKVAMEKVK